MLRPAQVGCNNFKQLNYSCRENDMTDRPNQSNKFATLESAKKLSIASNDKTRFSNRLGPLLTKEHKDIRELAAVAGCSYEMARRYLVGSGKPSYERIERIAGWLGVDPDWLAFGDKTNEDQKDFTPRRVGIPVYRTGSQTITGHPDQYIDVGLRNEKFAVKIDNPLGIEIEVGNFRMFKAGDVCLIGDTGIGLGDYVLIESKEQDTLNRYIIRRVEFDAKMRPVFVSNRDGYPALTTDDYKVVGRVTAIFSTV
jgi:transcriptional regulator with XRE-family HTH domain